MFIEAKDDGGGGDNWTTGAIRPTVTFPAARHHRPLAATKLYCLVTEASVPKVALDSRVAGSQTRESTMLNSDVTKYE